MTRVRTAAGLACVLALGLSGCSASSTKASATFTHTWMFAATKKGTCRLDATA